MERQKPTTQLRHHDDFSKALIESTAAYISGKKVVKEEGIPTLEKKEKETTAKRDPKANAHAADPAVDLRTGSGIKQSHGATIKYTNVVAKEAWEKPEKEEKGEKKHKEGKAEEKKEKMKESFNVMVEGVHYVFEKKNAEGKEQGADGKACWKGYKYAGTEGGKDKCVKAGYEPIGELMLDEKAPPGAKYERMVKHIKKGYSEGGVTKKEKGIAYATAWKAKNKAVKEALDPVGKEDKDIDNDGDHDKSDKYLAARRKKVTSIINKSKTKK